MRLASLPGTAPAHALHIYLPREVEILVKGVAVSVHGLEGRVTSLASRTLASRTVCGLVDESALTVTRPAPLLPVCGLDEDRDRDRQVHSCSRSDRLRLQRLHSRSSGRRKARHDLSRSHDSRYWLRDSRWSCDRSPLSSDRSWSWKRSWWPGRGRLDREEAVVASPDLGNSGSKVEPTPAVAGGSIPLSTSFPYLVRLFLSLSGPVAQRDAAKGSLLTAAGVTSAGVLPGPAALVTYAAPVACSSASVPAPGVMTPVSAASDRFARSM